VAVIAGVGDHVDEMAKAEALGAQAYITGELHVRIEGEYGRAKFADVRSFAATTGMTLIGVSHAASEHLVFETQLARWLTQRHGIGLTPIRESKWWR
jgi:putative NIF3 family GTP cyclohydrolase 1 type 2